MPIATLAVSDALLGSSAALLTSMLWVLTSLFFTAAGHRIPITAVNTIRIVVAIALLGVTHLILTGTLWPEIPHQRQLIALALSGLIGLSLCDQALFTAFMDMGPRRALLCMTTSPIFALLFGAVFLGERIPLTAYAAIMITLGGVIWVIAERSPQPAEADGPKKYTRLKRGVVLALIGAVSQAAGGMFSKVGMGVGWLPEAAQMPAQSATLVRMVFGLFGMAPIVLVFVVMSRKAGGQPDAPHRWVPGLTFTALGAVVGPFLGVWMSLVAFKFSPLAIAQTLCSLSPVLILPFAHYVMKERVTLRATIGAVIALGGAVLLTFAGRLDSLLASMF